MYQEDRVGDSKQLHRLPFSECSHGVALVGKLAVASLPGLFYLILQVLAVFFSSTGKCQVGALNLQALLPSVFSSGVTGLL